MPWLVHPPQPRSTLHWPQMLPKIQSCRHRCSLALAREQASRHSTRYKSHSSSVYVTASHNTANRLALHDRVPAITVNQKYHILLGHDGVMSENWAQFIKSAHQIPIEWFGCSAAGPLSVAGRCSAIPLSGHVDSHSSLLASRTVH